MTISRQTDLGNAMAGKVSGARFIGGASSGFDAGTIILRGAGSIPSSSQSDNPANEPIYVVDGAITNKNSINMDDVESINVLKGPAATALYGSRGGAGAIIITTKAGQSEKGLLEVSHTLQAETYYNHFNMQKLYGGGGYGGTEKVTGLRIFMICIVVIFPVCKVLMCTIIMRTLLGELHTIRL